MNKFSKVPKYNVNIQNLVYLYILATNDYKFKLNKQTKTTIYNSIKIMKYLRINMTKNV